MKRSIFILAFVLFSSIAFSQNLQKGNVMGFHNGTFVPNPDVTLNQCISFMKDKYLPAVEKAFPGVKCYALKGVRGESVDCISFVYLFSSDDVRNKFWKEEGVFTELGNSATKQLEPLNTEMAKFGKFIDKYTDWVVL